MISKEDFIVLIQEYNIQNKRVHNLCETFSNAFDSPVIGWGYRMFDKLINSYFTKEGVDWIYAYLFEGCRKYWIDNVEYKLNSLEDLWNLIEPYRKSDNSIEN